MPHYLTFPRGTRVFEDRAEVEYPPDINTIRETIQESLSELGINAHINIDNIEFSLDTQMAMRMGPESIRDDTVQLNCTINFSNRVPIKRKNWVEKELSKEEKYDIIDSVTREDIGDA